MACASVESQTTLGGVTTAQFGKKEAEAVKTAVAKTAGASKNSVQVISIKETSRRATGLEVDTQVYLMGDKAADVEATQAKLANKTSLQSNLQAADSSTSLKSATVASTSAKPGVSVAADTSQVSDPLAKDPASRKGAGSTSSSSGGSMMIIIIVVVVVAVAVIVGGGVAFYMMRSPKAPDTVHAKLEDKQVSPGIAVDMESPPPGATYKKNGVWMDGDGKPIGDPTHEGIQ
jgi:cobalamin biosynthesis Mg chelatase CobN